LLYDNKLNSDDRIIIFALDEGLKYLTEAHTWYCDGNFSLSLENFLQLYVFRVKKYDVKIYSTYKKVFSVILKECDNRQFYPDPQIINLDFKPATINAAQRVLGEHVRIQGCFYQLSQNTYRKIQEVGLQAKYKTDDILSHFFAMLDGLPFLPMNKVYDGMQYLKTVCTEEATEVLDYSDSTYVNGTYRKSGKGMAIKLKKNKPLFLPEIWNVHEVTINGQHRTNNICKSLNNRFTHLVGHAHPTVWKLISKMREELGVDRTKIALQELGEGIPTPKKRTGERLKNLCSRVAIDEISMEEFLINIGHCIRKRNKY